jgi:hypothetical protein
MAATEGSLNVQVVHLVRHGEGGASEGCTLSVQYSYYELTPRTCPRSVVQRWIVSELQNCPVNIMDR